MTRASLRCDLRSRDVAKSKWPKTGPSLVSSLQTAGIRDMDRNRGFAKCLVTTTPPRELENLNSESVIHTIFEGTSEIQQLVISRAISGLRIE